MGVASSELGILRPDTADMEGPRGATAFVVNDQSREETDEAGLGRAFALPVHILSRLLPW